MFDAIDENSRFHVLRHKIKSRNCFQPMFISVWLLAEFETEVYNVK